MFVCYNDHNCSYITTFVLQSVYSILSDIQNFVQYSGPYKDAIAYVTWLKEDNRFSNILVQISLSFSGHAFPRLKMRYKPSLVQASYRFIAFPICAISFSILSAYDFPLQHILSLSLSFEIYLFLLCAK